MRWSAFGLISCFSITPPCPSSFLLGEFSDTGPCKLLQLGGKLPSSARPLPAYASPLSIRRSNGQSGRTPPRYTSFFLRQECVLFFLDRAYPRWRAAGFFFFPASGDSSFSSRDFFEVDGDGLTERMPFPSAFRPSAAVIFRASRRPFSLPFSLCTGTGRFFSPSRTADCLVGPLPVSPQRLFDRARA